MLETLTLRNFQTHARLRIDFDPRVTTIVGRTDAGKSAVVRALRWLAFNRPAGGAFIRAGAAEAGVRLRVDGRTVSRRKGKGRNSYALDGAPLKAFGADVPDGVTKLLALGPDNFQSQHDPPFWFSASAGEVSRSLNKIIHLGAIDETLGRLNRKLRDAGAEASVCRERLRAAREEERGRSVAEAMDVKLRKIEKIEKQLNETRRTAVLLGDLVRNVRRHRARADRAAKRLETALAAMSFGGRWAETDERLKTLQKLVSAGRRQERAAGLPVPDVRGVERVAAALQNAEARHTAVGAMVEQAVRAQTIIDRSGEEAAAVEKTFHRLLGERCPLCKQKIRK